MPDFTAIFWLSFWMSKRASLLSFEVSLSIKFNLGQFTRKCTHDSHNLWLRVHDLASYEIKVEQGRRFLFQEVSAKCLLISDFCGKWFSFSEFQSEIKKIISGNPKLHFLGLFIQSSKWLIQVARTNMKHVKTNHFKFDQKRHRIFEGDVLTDTELKTV